MDLSEIRRLANTMSSAASEIGATVTRLVAAMDNAYWHGREAEEFRREWAQRHRPALASLIEGLNTTSRHLNVAAREQEQVSAK